MVRLGLNTIGELVRQTGDDLLECKNFGVTSLNEVREKLTAHGPQAPRRLSFCSEYAEELLLRVRRANY